MRVAHSSSGKPGTWRGQWCQPSEVDGLRKPPAVPLSAGSPCGGIQEPADTHHARDVSGCIAPLSSDLLFASCDDFASAAALLRGSQLIAPAFIALSGGQSSQGSIFTFGINQRPSVSVAAGGAALMGLQEATLGGANQLLAVVGQPEAHGSAHWWG